MSVLFDAGALIAVDRGDQDLVVLAKRERVAGRPIRTHGGVVGQAWRSGGPRQARLARLLVALDVRPLTESLGRRSGELLAATGTSDVIDAALAVLARDGDRILTSDPDDIRTLVRSAGRRVEVVEV